VRRVVLAALGGILTAVTVAAPAMAARPATVDDRAVRAQIVRLVGQTYPGLRTGNVMCPPGIARSAGGSFACTVQLPGTFLVIGAQQADDHGRIKLAAQQAVVPRTQIEQLVAANATVPATVTCGTTDFVVARPGQKITCAAALADGSRRTVEVTVRDVDGNVVISNVS
jgi:hypothetical protein